TPRTGSTRPALLVPHRLHQAALSVRKRVHEGAGDGDLPRHARRDGPRPRRRPEHPHRSRGSSAEGAACLRDRVRSPAGRSPHHPRSGRPHDYQPFLHEAGPALHYAGCDPKLPYTYRRIARDHALTEIYAYICEAVTREPEWHMRYFGLSAEDAR